MKEKEKNIAFIDGQNLYLGTNGYIDAKKFRIYLKDKYNIEEAYYFLGYIIEKEQDLYDNLQKFDYILSFREHSPLLKAKKKGNVDTDIVFSVMKKLLKNKQ